MTWQLMLRRPSSRCGLLLVFCSFQLRVLDKTVVFRMVGPVTGQARWENNFAFAQTAIDIGFGFSVFCRRSSSLIVSMIAVMFGNLLTTRRECASVLDLWLRLPISQEAVSHSISRFVWFRNLST